MRAIHVCPHFLHFHVGVISILLMFIIYTIIYLIVNRFRIFIWHEGIMKEL